MTSKQKRELDALLAEKVLRLTRAKHIGDLKEGFFFAHPTQGVYLPGQGNYIIPWSPTTKPADAFAVLEKCAHSALNEVRVRRMGDYWAATLCCYVWPPFEAPTLELAICSLAKQLFA